MKRKYTAIVPLLTAITFFAACARESGGMPRESASDIKTPAQTATAADIKPETPLQGVMIGIDAGHQAKGSKELEPNGPDSDEKKARVSSGTEGRISHIPEYEVNLAVALLLKEKLTALGAEVVMTRVTHDVDISNRERALIMNDARVELCLRIHADGSEDVSIHGASMLVPTQESNPGIADESQKAGEIILQSFIAATGAADRGVHPRSDQTGFNWSTVPVCTIEMGFMSNETEDALLVDPAYQEKCAQGLADGICEWARIR